MVKSILAFLLVLISTFSFAQSINHVAIEGTDCYLIPPLGFVSAPEINGFRNSTKTAVISAKKLPIPYSDMEKELTSEMLATMKMTLLDRQDLSLLSGKGIQLKVSYSLDGKKYIRQSVMFGNETVTIAVNGDYPEEQKELEESVKKSLLSTIFQVMPTSECLKTVKYSIRIPGNYFKLSRFLGNCLFFTVDGTIPTSKPYLMTTRIPETVPTADQKEFSVNLLKVISEGDVSDPESATEFQAGEMKGYELISRVDAQGKKQLHYVATLFDKTSGSYMVAGVANEAPEANLNRFREIAKTLRRGSFSVSPTGQTDTMYSYLDGDDDPSTYSEAKSYRIVWKDGDRWIGKTFLMNGSMLEDEMFSDDSLKIHEGLCLRWYNNGVLADSLNFRNGKLNGQQAWYHENGQKSEAGTYLNGKPKKVSYWNADGTVEKHGESNERMPQYKSERYADLQDYLIKNLHYPDSARERGQEGRALVRFVVNAEGKVDNVSISKSSGVDELDDEALRVMDGMEWTPGIQHNRRVRVYYTLPVTFKLD